MLKKYYKPIILLILGGGSFALTILDNNKQCQPSCGPSGLADDVIACTAQGCTDQLHIFDSIAVIVAVLLIFIAVAIALMIRKTTK